MTLNKRKESPTDEDHTAMDHTKRKKIEQLNISIKRTPLFNRSSVSVSSATNPHVDGDFEDLYHKHPENFPYICKYMQHVQETIQLASESLTEPGKPILLSWLHALEKNLQRARPYQLSCLDIFLHSRFDLGFPGNFIGDQARMGKTFQAVLLSLFTLLLARTKESDWEKHYGDTKMLQHAYEPFLIPNRSLSKPYIIPQLHHPSVLIKIKEVLARYYPYTQQSFSQWSHLCEVPRPEAWNQPDFQRFYGMRLIFCPARLVWKKEIQFMYPPSVLLPRGDRWFVQYKGYDFKRELPLSDQTLWVQVTPNLLRREWVRHLAWIGRHAQDFGDHWIQSHFLDFEIEKIRDAYSKELKRRSEEKYQSTPSEYKLTCDVRPSLLYLIGWREFMIDEAHMCKELKADVPRKVALTAKSTKSMSRRSLRNLTLTATPTPEDNTEFVAQTQLCRAPAPFDNPAYWSQMGKYCLDEDSTQPIVPFCNKDTMSHCQPLPSEDDEDSQKKKLQEFLRHFRVRRIRSEFAYLGFPDIHEITDIKEVVLSRLQARVTAYLSLQNINMDDERQLFRKQSRQAMELTRLGIHDPGINERKAVNLKSHKIQEMIEKLEVVDIVLDPIDADILQAIIPRYHYIKVAFDEAFALWFMQKCQQMVRTWNQQKNQQPNHSSFSSCGFTDEQIHWAENMKPNCLVTLSHVTLPPLDDPVWTEDESEDQNPPIIEPVSMNRTFRGDIPDIFLWKKAPKSAFWRMKFALRPLLYYNPMMWHIIQFLVWIQRHHPGAKVIVASERIQPLDRLTIFLIACGLIPPHEYPNIPRTNHKNIETRTAMIQAFQTPSQPLRMRYIIDQTFSSSSSEKDKDAERGIERGEGRGKGRGKGEEEHTCMSSYLRVLGNTVFQDLIDEYNTRSPKHSISRFRQWVNQDIEINLYIIKSLLYCIPDTVLSIIDSYSGSNYMPVNNIILLSRAGHTAITLDAADYLILCTSAWNGCTEDQISERGIGTKGVCHIWKFIPRFKNPNIPTMADWKCRKKIRKLEDTKLNHTKADPHRRKRHMRESANNQIDEFLDILRGNRTILSKINEDLEDSEAEPEEVDEVCFDLANNLCAPLREKTKRKTQTSCFSSSSSSSSPSVFTYSCTTSKRSNRLFEKDVAHLRKRSSSYLSQTDSHGWIDQLISSDKESNFPTSVSSSSSFDYHKGLRSRNVHIIHSSSSSSSNTNTSSQTSTFQRFHPSQKSSMSSATSVIPTSSIAPSANRSSIFASFYSSPTSTISRSNLTPTSLIPRFNRLSFPSPRLSSTSSTDIPQSEIRVSVVDPLPPIRRLPSFLFSHSSTPIAMTISS